MKKPSKQARKLVLQTETIVRLTELRLRPVAGGKAAVIASGISACDGCETVI
jgi:hypothetical protein